MAASSVLSEAEGLDRRKRVRVGRYYNCASKCEPKFPGRRTVSQKPAALHALEGEFAGAARLEPAAAQQLEA